MEVVTESKEEDKIIQGSFSYGDVNSERLETSKFPECIRGVLHSTTNETKSLTDKLSGYFEDDSGARQLAEEDMQVLQEQLGTELVFGNHTTNERKRLLRKNKMREMRSQE